MPDPTFVADPHEPRPRARLVRWRPWVAAALVAVLTAAVVWLVATSVGQDDPALEVGSAAPAATAAAPPA